MNLLSSLFGRSVPSVNAKELSERLKDGKRPLVIDVRQPEEYREGHIAGAKLILLGELRKRINELPKPALPTSVMKSQHASAQSHAFSADPEIS